MDPLSATASIIALVQAAVAVSKGVRFLRSFGQIPFEFTELLNELSTLHAVIEQVEAALREWETLRPTASYSTSSQSVDSSKVLSLKDNLAQVVKELDDLCRRLEAPRKKRRKHEHDEQNPVSKLRWQKEKSNIERLRYKAQYSRDLLSLCFSAFSSSQAQQHVKVTLDMQQMLYTAAGNIIQLQTQNTKAEEGSRTILKHLQESVDQLKQNLADQKLPQSSEHGVGASKQLLNPKSMVQFQATLVRECSSTCNCNCHQMRHSHSPRWLTTLIGNLFLQYNTIPVFQSPTCDGLTCTAKSLPSVRLYYAFPYWLVARSIEFNVSWSSLFGLGSSLHIRVPRVLMSHPIWRAIQFGDIHWVQLSLANKSVLPTDVDRWGHSLVTVALHNHQYDLARLFAQQGCDIHSKDIFGQTAASTARLMKSITYSSPDIIQKMDASKNLLEEFSLRQQMRETVQSSKVHQAIIQDGDEILLAFTEASSVEINQLDGFGFAPLHWATYRRKSKIVRVLLEAGAAPDIMSRKGDTPLYIAANSRDVDSARLLLESGADVNLSNPFTGYTAIFAAYRHAEISRLILDYGAHLRRETIHGLQTPLYYAAQESYDREPNCEDRSSWAEWFQCLLSAGLDIDNQSGKHAIAPIMLSLWNRNAILLELLIDAGARLDLVDSKQRGILHWAVLSTTTESIEILRRAKISSINPDLPDAEGETPLMWLASRMYASDENLAAGERRVTQDEFWAFKNLVDEIRERNRETRQLNPTTKERDEGVFEIDASMEIASDSNNSVVGWWGGSRVIRARSTSSGCDEFLDFEDESGLVDPLARRILAERLGDALNLAPKEVEEFKYFCTAGSYFRLRNHEGGIVMPGTKHYRRGKKGKREEYTFSDVPWKAILDAAESRIERMAGADDRTRLFEEVMRGLPGRKSTPRWDKSPANPNAKPTTPYSRYRTKEGEEAPTNAQMLKSFGEAAGLDDGGLNFVSAQITWWDAMGDDDRPPILGSSKRKHTVANSSDSDAASTTSTSLAEPRWAVSGGRLGRDHTFADVPSHYARDRLVHYTLTQLDSGKHDQALAALCPDLDQSEITAYSKCIAEGRVVSGKDEAGENHVLKGRNGNRGHKRASQGGEHSGKKTKRTKTPKA
ncbi:hypothetical protein O1611_g1658 [Lasiodiplodia mahajangana]|uniref:Uncharacterized protein n=1 Tax=Lasiodiplodia mahajangana TaxID=1108764 RepID=A0ACC2JXL4_9PEZI|nr:hypothetical protein O1611_g1658 [Lasiodiplodia mahajangana]